MSIAVLKLDQPTTLEFGVEITGADGKPEARFIIEGKDFSVSYPCTQVPGGVEVEISALKNIFSAGEYKARLEVVLENKIYYPLSDKIEFEPTVSIETKTKPIVKEAVKVSVAVKKAVISEDILRKTQAATIIAKALNYIPEDKQTPREIINAALEHAGELTNEQKETVKEMLAIAEAVGVEYNKDFAPLIIEESETADIVPAKKEQDDDGWTEEDLDKLANTVNDWSDIVDAYEPGELHIEDEETGEKVDDLKEDLKENTLNEVLSRLERIRARVRFHKSAAKRERKLKIALTSHSSSEKINHRARVLAIKLLKEKLAKKPLSSLNTAEKERLEKMITKRKGAVNRLAMKLTTKVRKIEKDRLTSSHS